MQRLALGTAQFGLAYGIANRHGQITVAEGIEILDSARAAGIDMLDTAISYGDSEQRLGEIGVRGWRIISKLPGLPDDIADVGRWVNKQLTASLLRLRVDNLDGLLLHRPNDLLSKRGDALYTALQNLKVNGIIDKIGFSIYTMEELEALFPYFDIDLVQAPFNILDRRLVNSGWLDRLQENDIEVHVRSVFLQGLLLMAPEDCHGSLNREQPILQRWHSWLKDTGTAPLSACIGFALAPSGIERVIVGVDSLAQFREILSAAASPFIQPPDDMCSEDPDLINPSRWQHTP